MQPSLICGVDPGLRRTGYAILAVEDDEFTVVEAGLVRCRDAGALSQRLVELADAIGELLSEHAVELLAIEQVYSHYRHPRTAILMAHGRGVILLEAARRGAEIVHLPATTIKRALTGNGRARKSQVQRAIADALGLDAPPEPDDVADALAIALCAVHLRRHPARIAAGNDALLPRRSQA